MTVREAFDRLRCNPYPGRGLIVGRAAGGDFWLILYWIMGRSTASRARRFAVEGSVLRTVPLDPGRVANPELLIYEAMAELPGRHIVSNGDQTRTVLEALRSGGRFEDALATREREPDAPNFTPRITALLDLTRPPGEIALSLLRANPLDPSLTDRFTYRPALPPPGVGYGLTTYAGDGRPLPAFTGDPLLLPLGAKAEETLDTYWEALNPEHRVALAVKEIPAAGGPSRIVVRNRF